MSTRPASSSKPFDWSRYLAIADELAKRSDEESLRTAISRAYYYVYHLALQRAEGNNFQALAGEGTHSQLWRIFSTSPDPDCRRLGIIADRLKGKREMADYKHVYVRIDEETPEILRQVRAFAATLGRLPLRFPDPKHARR